MRRVRNTGYFVMNGRPCWLGEAFVGQSIAVRPTTVDGLWDIYYSRHRVGQLDVRVEPPGGSHLAVMRPSQQQDRS